MYLYRSTSARNPIKSIALVDTPPVTAGRILKATSEVCMATFTPFPTVAAEARLGQVKQFVMPDPLKL